MFFEKVKFARLYKYLSKFSPISNNQFGFRRGHSEYSALVQLHSKISDAPEKIPSWDVLRPIQGLRHGKSLISDQEIRISWSTGNHSRLVSKSSIAVCNH